MPDLRPVTEDARWKQQVQDAQLVSGQRVLEGVDIELVEPIDKLLLPDDCFYAQPPYEYANELDEGPNVSYKPNVALSEGWAHAVCFAVTIAFEAGLALVGWLTWRAWPQIVAAYVWLRSVL